ncbi:MAG: porin family protein [Alistipes sp.]|nr:porin family protein [Alistipes sp.]
MKRILLVIILSLAAHAAACAQERGNIAAGPKLGLYTRTGGGAVFGVGAEVRYNISDPLRVAPSIVWLTREGCTAEIACDWHYMFRVAPHWHLYPLAGISANDFGRWTAGIDLGFGTDYALGKHVDLTAQAKWMVQCSEMKSPLVIFAGLMFRF